MAELPIGPHPVVIISPPKVAASTRYGSINVLLCSSIRGSDRLEEDEVYLDEADGLDHATGCQCHAMLSVPKSRTGNWRLMGEISLARRRMVKNKLRDNFCPF
jgi:hypothetical protein